MQAILNNREHPEYGEVDVTLPIPEAEYDLYVERLEALGIGDAKARDCNIVGFHDAPPYLDCLKERQVNIDELDFLMRRVDMLQFNKIIDRFQAAAMVQNITDMTNLINLTYYCDCATVVKGDEDLTAIGERHYINLHGGAVAAKELETVDFEQVARDLLSSGRGQETPYGTVYLDGMEPREYYGGGAIPEFYDRDGIAVVRLRPADDPETNEYTFLHLPAANQRIARALERGGFSAGTEVFLQVEVYDDCPREIDKAFVQEGTVILSDDPFGKLNEMSRAVSALSEAEKDKLEAVSHFAKPRGADQARELVERLALFDFVPGAASPEELGEEIAQNQGEFNEYGYVAYKGDIRLGWLMQAIVRNKEHPEYGSALVPLPISDDAYDGCVDRLKKLGIGDVRARDCYVAEFWGGPPYLDCLKDGMVNVEELDYLARRVFFIDCNGHLDNFQAVAALKGFTEMTDLINLTFYCEDMTVISGHGSLDRLGKEHYERTHPDCTNEEYQALDGEKILSELMESGEGQNTLYGMVYTNGVEEYQPYQGERFPEFPDRENTLVVELRPAAEPEAADRTQLQLPTAAQRIARTLERDGFAPDTEAWMRVYVENHCLSGVAGILGKNQLVRPSDDPLGPLNEISRAVQPLSCKEEGKLAAVLHFARPQDVTQIKSLTENLDLFDFVPGAKTPEELGEDISQVRGEFNEYGYVAYKGNIRLDEAMGGRHTERMDMQMGGLS